MATAAFNAVDRLDNQYRNTHQDRMRIRTVYHGDTFASLIEALTAIPVHELDTVEAVIALVGLKKNMIDAQRWLDQFVAEKNRLDDDALHTAVDLRACKTFAEAHYQGFVQALKASDTGR
jgi:hypothetical protein